MPLDNSITVNLDGAHYLKVGLALQPTASASETDGSKALNEVINVYSNMTVKELSSAEGRATAKAELVARIKLAYIPEGKLTEEEIVKENEAASGGKVKETEDLSAAQAEKRAAALTVQPDSTTSTSPSSSCSNLPGKVKGPAISRALHQSRPRAPRARSPPARSAPKHPTVPASRRAARASHRP